MQPETIRFEVRGPVAWIRLNRPRVMNAISPELLDELAAALDQAAGEGAIRVLAITGSGPAFCAGADLAHVLDSVADGDSPSMGVFLDRIAEVFGAVARFPKPAIAALNGLTLAGGLELAMCCDLIVAAESARIGDAHANYGLLPGGGAAVRLPRRVSVQLAKYLLYTGDFLPAGELAAAGLVNRVVPDEALERTVQLLGERIASKSPIGLRRLKRLVDDALEQPQDTALRLERLTFDAHQRSEDMLEGLKAFREKRRPEFRGC